MKTAKSAKSGTGESKGRGEKSRPVADLEGEKTRRAHYVSILCAVTMETDKGIKRICETLRKEDPDFPAARTIREWIAEDADLNAQYARAKNEQLEHMAEQLVEIADDDSLDVAFNDDGKPFVNTEHIQRSKLRVDTRKWILSKLLPKKYGEKITHAGDEDNPVVLKHKHELSEEELLAIAARSSN